MRHVSIKNREGLHLKSFCTCALLLATTLTTFANQSVRLIWSPSPSPDIVGYDIYYGQASDDYTNEVSTGDVTNLTVSGLSDGTTYFFAARAVNGSGLESELSLQTSYTVPTAAARLGRPVFSSNGLSVAVTGVPGYLYAIQASTDLVNWISLQTNVSPLLFTDTNEGRYKRRFYRAVYLF